MFKVKFWFIFIGTIFIIFFSSGSKPLEIWDLQVKNGYIKRFLDEEIKNMVIEIRGNNVSTTYITCPKGNEVLGITMPFLVMIVKNLKKYFSFEVTILDETGTRRRFRMSSFQSSTQILPLCTVMPICLSPGWNQIQFNLAEFCKRAYKKQYIEVQKLKINANIIIRRIYFAEKLLSEDELPAEYKLFFPLQTKRPRDKKKSHILLNETIKLPEKTALMPTSLTRVITSQVATAASQTIKPENKRESLNEVTKTEEPEANIDTDVQEEEHGTEKADEATENQVDAEEPDLERQPSTVVEGGEEEQPTAEPDSEEPAPEQDTEDTETVAENSELVAEDAAPE